MSGVAPMVIDARCTDRGGGFPLVRHNDCRHGAASLALLTVEFGAEYRQKLGHLVPSDVPEFLGVDDPVPVRKELRKPTI